MHHTMAPNKLLEIPTSLRLLLTVNQRGYLGAGFPSRARSFSHTNPLLISSNSLPRILQPSLWHTILPKRFRRSKESITAADAGQGRRKWNPATPFIVLGLLIGSQAIHTLVLRNQMAAYSRKAEAKIALLKEIVERIQRGEDVAVEKLLGTDDPTQEKEWAEVIKEIEAADTQWRKKKKQKAAPVEEAPKPKAASSPPEPSVDHDISRRASIPRGFY